MERALIRHLMIMAVLWSGACTAEFSRSGDVLPCGPEDTCGTGYVCTPVDRLGRVCLTSAQRPMFCEDMERCDGHDNTCDGRIDEMLTRTCTTACGQGIAECQRGDWGPCSARQPTVERCDGIDNDCQNGVDDPWVLLLRQSCTVGRGACMRTGQYICTPDHLGVTCGATAGMAGTEVCNNVDDNCDGMIDNGVTPRGCASTIGSGTETCHGGVWTDCTAPAPVAESCDGIDNDGVRGADDPWVFLLNQPCTVGVGSCARTGVYRCTPGGRGVACDAVPGMSATEECNGADDDCDGEVDELSDIAPLAIGFDAPPCRPRVDVCIDGDYVTIQTAHAPGTETCNGVDDDCDGVVDQPWRTGAMALGMPCARVWDACRGRTTGVYVCAPDGTGTICNAPEPAGRPAQPESCNDVDDDCDGEIDGTRGTGGARIPLTRPCYPFADASTRNVGSCRTGTTTCDRGRFGDCMGAIGPTAEVCDQRNNDCDAQTDELSVDGAAFDAGTSTWTFDDDFERTDIAPWSTANSVRAVPFLASGLTSTGTRAVVLAASHLGGRDQRAAIAYPIHGCASFVELQFDLAVEAWTESRAEIALQLVGLPGVIALSGSTSGTYTPPSGTTSFVHNLSARNAWVSFRLVYDRGDVRLFESGGEVFRVSNVATISGVELAATTCCADDAVAQIRVDRVRLRVRP